MLARWQKKKKKFQTPNDTGEQKIGEILVLHLE